jgi:hypothetical protein
LVVKDISNIPHYGQSSYLWYFSTTKLCIHRSIDSEMVINYDFVGQFLWTEKLLQEKGFSTSKIMIYQENMRSTFLDKNVTYPRK